MTNSLPLLVILSLSIAACKRTETSNAASKQQDGGTYTNPLGVLGVAFAQGSSPNHPRVDYPSGEVVMKGSKGYVKLDRFGSQFNFLAPGCLLANLSFTSKFTGGSYHSSRSATVLLGCGMKGNDRHVIGFGKSGELGPEVLVGIEMSKDEVVKVDAISMPLDIIASSQIIVPLQKIQ